MRLFTFHHEDGLIYLRLGYKGWGIRIKKWSISLLKPYK